MRNRLWLAVWLSLFVLEACTLPSNNKVVPSPQSEGTATQFVPTFTQLPALTRTPTMTVMFARAKELPVNCRFGPGVIYEIVSGLKPNQSSQIAGRNINDTWWYIHDPLNPGGYCWVAADATDVEGETESIPVVDPPVTSVTSVQVRVEPQRITILCNQFPQSFLFVADITTNGPALVVWKWEVSTGEIGEEQSFIFDAADTKTSQLYFTVTGPNDYWVRAHIYQPNEILGQSNFYATCIR